MSTPDVGYAEKVPTDDRQLVPWTIRLPAELDTRVRRYIVDSHREDPAVRASVTGLVVDLLDRHLHRRGYRRGEDVGEDVGPQTATEELADDPGALLDAIEEHVSAGGSVLGLARDAGLSRASSGLVTRWRAGEAPSLRVRLAFARALLDTAEV